MGDGSGLILERCWWWAQLCLPLPAQRWGGKRPWHSWCHPGELRWLHTLQLLKASEQLLIVPDAANEIIAARHWEPLPGPCCWGQGCHAAGCGCHRVWGAPRYSHNPL